MKQLTTIFLILIMFLQSFSRFVVEADFFLNQNYIAKVLCVNKEKPKMHCSGKCYLAKQLQEQEKQDQQVPVTKKAKSEVQLFYASQSISLTPYMREQEVHYLPVNITQLSSFQHSIFRPPTA